MCIGMCESVGVPGGKGVRKEVKVYIHVRFYTVHVLYIKAGMIFPAHQQA